MHAFLSHHVKLLPRQHTALTVKAKRQCVTESESEKLTIISVQMPFSDTRSSQNASKWINKINREKGLERIENKLLIPESMLISKITSKNTAFVHAA